MENETLGRQWKLVPPSHISPLQVVNPTETPRVRSGNITEESSTENDASGEPSQLSGANAADPLADLIEYDSEPDENPGLVFANPADLKVRQKRDNLERSKEPSFIDPNRCYICARDCAFPAHLETHLSHHIPMLPFSCKQCEDPAAPPQPTIVSLVSLHKHFQSHSYSHKCPHCPKRFNGFGGMYTHILDKHESQGKELTCDDCGLKFETPRKLWYHQRSQRDLQAGTYRCEFCSKCFGNNSRLVRHLRTHTGAKPYHCDHCPATFSDATVLQQHRQRHINERGYRCDTCGDQFITGAQLKAHALKHVVPEAKRPPPPKKRPSTKPKATHDCPHCDRKFPHNYLLEQHVAMVHSNNHPFRCEVCGQKFARLANLQKHGLLHDNVLPHECPGCDKRFVSRGNLVEHMAVHSKDRYFQCEQRGCTAAYKFKTTLNKHRMVKHGLVADGSVIFRRVEVDRGEDNGVDDDDELRVACESIEVGQFLEI